mmetsp:Transcript_29273/g.40813  ORF Transcript_29273/g.40813 Transcript_29273/m.40813 type:complete len:160 (-) Transcript_29273:1350-1829(-)
MRKNLSVIVNESEYIEQFFLKLLLEIGIINEINYWYKKILFLLFPTTIQIIGLRNFVMFIELYKTLYFMLFYLRTGKIRNKLLDRKTLMLMQKIINRYYYTSSILKHSNIKLQKFFRSKMVLFLRIDYYSKNVRKIDFNSIKKIFKPRIITLISKKKKQ